MAFEDEDELGRLLETMQNEREDRFVAARRARLDQPMAQRACRGPSA